MQKVIHSDNIKYAIQALGWSQKDLAAKLGVTGQAVTNWMKGTSQVGTMRASVSKSLAMDQIMNARIVCRNRWFSGIQAYPPWPQLEPQELRAK